MKSERPLVCQGTAPPAAKKEVMFLPCLENAIPAESTPMVHKIIIIVSIGFIVIKIIVKVCVIYVVIICDKDIMNK